MRRFLFLALCMGMLLPTAANAETWYLILGGRFKHVHGMTDLIKVPMSSEQECDAAGAKINGDSGIHGDIYMHVRHICIKGK